MIPTGLLRPGTPIPVVGLSVVEFQLSVFNEKEVRMDILTLCL
jgi:hypothetical protein